MLNSWMVSFSKLELLYLKKRMEPNCQTVKDTILTDETRLREYASKHRYRSLCFFQNVSTDRLLKL